MRVYIKDNNRAVRNVLITTIQLTRRYFNNAVKFANADIRDFSNTSRIISPTPARLPCKFTFPATSSYFPARGFITFLKLDTLTQSRFVNIAVRD